MAIFSGRLLTTMRRPVLGPTLPAMSLFPVTIHPKKHLSHAAVLVEDTLVPGVRVPSLLLFGGICCC